jgi:hypothetical protein
MTRLLLTLVALGILSAALVGCHAEGDVQKPSSTTGVSLAR